MGIPKQRKKGGRILLRGSGEISKDRRTIKMTQQLPTQESIQIQQTVKRVIEEAMEKKRIQKELTAINKELDNIYLFRDILGIRYIPAVNVVREEIKC